MTDALDLVAVSLLPTRMWRLAADALRGGGSPAQVLSSLVTARWPADASRLSTLRADAAAALARAATAGIGRVTWSDPAYPIALTTIADPPAVIWTRGRVEALNATAVAIVGSRAASQYGLSVAGQLAGDLATRGVVVVSGLARGVDSAAHRGALAAGGVTIGVLGSGVDVIYPREHASLAAQIDERGAVISELVPGTPPTPFFFPLRNRIISGLSRAVVVVEANEKSGSLITARCALDQGRDVLAVPGNVLTGRNRGAHALLRDGAKIVESADDILEELGVRIDPSASGCTEKRGATPADDPVLACLTPGEPCDLDAIAERCGLGPAALLPRLLALELAGIVERIGGGRFVRADRTVLG
ncbi:MAG TPA: DNA-processing protein DprA [Vicinamibacterales bacterium]|nr:DNA-processing protein DprA [Vicinamibacterales bacterium]